MAIKLMMKLLWIRMQV